MRNGTTIKGNTLENLGPKLLIDAKPYMDDPKRIYWSKKRTMIYKILMLLCGSWCLFIVGCTFKDTSPCVVVFNLDHKFITENKKYDNIDSLLTELKVKNIRKIIFKTEIKYTEAEKEKTLNYFKKNNVKLIEFWVPVSDNVEGKCFHNVIEGYK